MDTYFWILVNLMWTINNLPFPVVARSKAYVCGRLPAGIAGSILAGDMDVCLLWMLCC